MSVSLEAAAGAPSWRPAVAPGRPRSRRDWLVDLAFTAFSLVVGALLFSNQVRRNDLSGWEVAGGAAAGVVACAALWSRRRHPVAVAAAILPLAVLSSFAAAAGLVAFFTVAVHRGLGPVTWLAAVALPALVVSYALQAADRPEVQTSLWLSLLSLVLLHVAVAASGLYVRARRLLLASLRERAERAEAAQHELARRAREQERALIAREMHDVLAHRLSLLSLHAGSLEFRPDVPPGEVASAAAVIRESAHQALDDLRAVIGILRDRPAGEAPGPPQPTLADVPGLVEESRAAGMALRADVAIDGPAGAPDAVGRAAYRIVQEGLTNARKHARGTSVSLLVAGGPGAGLTIEVRNPLPIGADAAAIAGAGSGLIGLAERVSLTGGRLEHGRTPAGEHRVHAWLPWPA
ncbi:MAG TPA: histidine kinase [Solirubrobacteraceae bacterium]